MANQGQALDAPRTVAFSFDPNDLTIITKPGDPLCQADRNALPVTREAVIAIAMGPPASSIRVKKLEDGRSAVATGRQRTKAACVANAIGAGVPYTGDLRAVKDAIAEFKKDPELCDRVTTLMRNKPIRLAAQAANFEDVTRLRGMIAIENARTQAEAKRAVIAAVQEDVNDFEIPVQVVAEQRGVSVSQVKRWLKVDLSQPVGKPKTRGKATRPSAAKVKAAGALAAEHASDEVRVVLDWVNGANGVDDTEFYRVFPALKPPKKSKAAA